MNQKTVTRWFAWIFFAVAVYILSSGPVLAACFWLREATGSRFFYNAIYLYYPLFIPGPSSPFVAYIELWCQLFNTVGPG